MPGTKETRQDCTGPDFTTKNVCMAIINPNCQDAKNEDKKPRIENKANAKVGFQILRADPAR